MSVKAEQIVDYVVHLVLEQDEQNRKLVDDYIEAEGSVADIKQIEIPYEPEPDGLECQEENGRGEGEDVAFGRSVVSRVTLHHLGLCIPVEGHQSQEDDERGGDFRYEKCEYHFGNYLIKVFSWLQSQLWNAEVR